MREILIKKCIICDNNYFKYAYHREKGVRIKNLSLKYKSIRSRLSLTCSKECSKKYIKIIKNINNRKNNRMYETIK